MRLELISIDKTLLAEVTLEGLFSAMNSRLVGLKMALETSKILLFMPSELNNLKLSHTVGVD